MLNKYVYKNKFLIILINLFDAIGYFIKRLIQKKNNINSYNLREAKKVVIFKLDHAGDVLLATPAIKAIRKELSKAHITLVVGPWGKGIVEGENYFNELICYSAYWHNREPRRVLNVRETINLIKTLRRGNYDIFFDLRGDLFAIIIAVLSKIPKRIGYGWMGGGFLLTDEIKTSIQKHQVEILLDSVKTLGIEPEISRPSITISSNDNAYVHRLLKEEGWKESMPTIGFHIGGGYPSKIWPVEKYVELITQLNHGFEIQILIVGGIDDIEISQKLENFLTFKPINIVAKTTFKQTAAAIEKCLLFIGNDSVPVHIAAAVGIPIIVIFSAANDYRRWRPFGDNITIITKNLPCSGCELQRCDHISCLQMITVDEVFDKVKEIIKPLSKQT